MPRLLGKGKLKPPSLLNTVRNSLAESFILAHCGDEAPDAGEAQTAKIVGDELKVPKANGFAEGESTARQTFTISSDGDHGRGNHQNV
jgi:hypothetical protein